jgi:hypothetical protein
MLRDKFVYASIHSDTDIRSRPIIIAISPPVLVPAIMSNPCNGSSFAPRCRPSWFMTCFKITRVESPRTLPPSSDRIFRAVGFRVFARELWREQASRIVFHLLIPES